MYRHPMPREGDSPLGYVREYAWALFWEFLVLPGGSFFAMDFM